MLGFSFDLSSIPGAVNVLSSLDNAKAQFLAVPAKINASLNRLAQVRQAMAANRAPTSAQSDALQVEQHLRQVQSEWGIAAQQFDTLTRARQSGSLSLDAITAAVGLVSSVGYVVTNENSLTSSVDALAAKYLSPSQVAQVNAMQLSPGGSVGASLVPILAIGAVAWSLLRKR